MEYTKIKEINNYVSKSVNPAKMPDTVFEMYSVPAFETGHPEYLYGKEIASSKIVVKKNDILLCKINPRINRVWIVLDESDNQSIASSEWIVIRTDDYNPEFLAWYFRTPQFQQRMMSEVTGIGGSLTRAQPKRVAEYPVPVLDRKRQDRIATVLNKIANIIVLRKKELKVYDELIKSRFVEMFDNERYPLIRLGDICSKITDGTHKTPNYLGDGVTFISAKNIVNGELDFSDIKHISEEEYQEIQNRCQTEMYDILLSKSGSLGTPVIVKTAEKLGLFESLAVIKYNREKIIPEFLCEQLKSDRIQRQFKTGTKGVAIKHLHLGVIADIKIIIPTIDKQRQFADFVKQLDKSKVAIQKSLEETQLLFNSLMQKYFD